MIRNMFKCVYRKKDGSKDFVILDRKNRERAFAQAKDLGLTVIEMLSCGKPVKVREQAKNENPAKNENSAPDLDERVLKERQISFLIGLFLPFLVTNLAMAMIFKLRGFIWSLVGSLMLIPFGLFFGMCFYAGNSIKSGEIMGALLSIGGAAVAGLIFQLVFRLMKTVDSDMI